tara:strand:- start:87 stop:428 length:342 start_codon:yes stop_codon:yes gene_type:complete
MKKLLLILLCFPFFSNASFPILSSLQINDTIINSKTPVKTQFDSLSKYPIGNETLAEYKERLKKNGFDNSQNKQPISWQRVIIIFFASLILIFLFVVWQMPLGIDLVSPFFEN